MLYHPPLGLERKRPIAEEEESKERVIETWYHIQLYVSFHHSYEFFSTATELKKSKWDTRKWNTNGAIRRIQRNAAYFVDPLVLSGPLLNKIRDGEFVALHGARASGKTTRVFRVMEQLEEEDYLCLQ